MRVDIRPAVSTRLLARVNITHKRSPAIQSRSTSFAKSDNTISTKHNDNEEKLCRHIMPHKTIVCFFCIFLPPPSKCDVIFPVTINTRCRNFEHVESASRSKILSKLVSAQVTRMTCHLFDRNVNQPLSSFLNVFRAQIYSESFQD